MAYTDLDVDYDACATFFVRPGSMLPLPEGGHRLDVSFAIPRVLVRFEMGDVPGMCRESLMLPWVPTRYKFLGDYPASVCRAPVAYASCQPDWLKAHSTMVSGIDAHPFDLWSRVRGVSVPLSTKLKSTAFARFLVGDAGLFPLADKFEWAGRFNLDEKWVRTVRTCCSHLPLMAVICVGSEEEAKAVAAAIVPAVQSSGVHAPLEPSIEVVVVGSHSTAALGLANTLGQVTSDGFHVSDVLITGFVDRVVRTSAVAPHRGLSEAPIVIHEGFLGPIPPGHLPVDVATTWLLRGARDAAQRDAIWTALADDLPATRSRFEDAWRVLRRYYFSFCRRLE